MDNYPNHHGQLRGDGAGRQAVQQRQVNHVYQIGKQILILVIPLLTPTSLIVWINIIPPLLPPTQC